MTTKTALIAAALALLVTASGCSDEKKTDLALEMAANKMVKEVDLHVKKGDMDKAHAILKELEQKYGHTKTYTENKARLLREGLATVNPEIALTGQRLIELENILFDFRKQTKRWPEPGQIRKPLDAWDNETYWILGGPKNSYDLLLVSAGADGEPGTGDELIVVWVEGGEFGRAHESRKNKKKDKKAAKSDVETTAQAAAAKGKKTETQVLTLEDLKKMEGAAGTPKEEQLSLDDFSSAGRASREAGQPRAGETVLSLEELKDNL